MIESALKSAIASAHIDRAPTTLKLFMAPEFLLRGPKGAYAAKMVFERIERQLHGIASRLLPADWMCVLGTCVGYTELPRRGRDPTYEVYNIAPIFAEGGDVSLGVLKKYKSGIDFLARPRLGGLSDASTRHMVHTGTPTVATHDAEEVLAFDSDGVFAAAGLTFGLEICLDHALGRLKATDGAARRVQVQLVPSGGMTVQPDAVAVVPNGLVLHCDGLTNGGNDHGAHSSAFVARPYDRARAPRGGASGGGHANPTNLQPLTPLAREPAHPDAWPAIAKDLYVTNKGAPTIAIYPAADLPPSA